MRRGRAWSGSRRWASRQGPERPSRARARQVERRRDRCHFDAAIGGAREGLDHRPVCQYISRHVDFLACSIDQAHVDLFEIFGRRVVNDKRGIGETRRQRGEEEECSQGGAEQAQFCPSRPSAPVQFSDSLYSRRESTKPVSAPHCAHPFAAALISNGRIVRPACGGF